MALPQGISVDQSPEHAIVVDANRRSGIGHVTVQRTLTPTSHDTHLTLTATNTVAGVKHQHSRSVNIHWPGTGV